MTPADVAQPYRRLRDANPEAHNRACAELASPRAPRGYQQPMVLSALVETADEHGLCPQSEKEIAGLTALPISHVRNAISHLISSGWIERVDWQTLKLTTKAFGETT